MIRVKIVSRWTYGKGNVILDWKTRKKKEREGKNDGRDQVRKEELRLSDNESDQMDTIYWNE